MNKVNQKHIKRSTCVEANKQINKHNKKAKTKIGKQNKSKCKTHHLSLNIIIEPCNLVYLHALQIEFCSYIKLALKISAQSV